MHRAIFSSWMCGRIYGPMQVCSRVLQGFTGFIWFEAPGDAAPGWKGWEKTLGRLGSRGEHPKPPAMPHYPWFYPILLLPSPTSQPIPAPRKDQTNLRIIPNPDSPDPTATERKKQNGAKKWWITMGCLDDHQVQQLLHVLLSLSKLCLRFQQLVLQFLQPRPSLLGIKAPEPHLSWADGNHSHSASIDLPKEKHGLRLANG